MHSSVTSFVYALWLSIPFIENNLVEAHYYGIGRTGQIFEQSRSSEETDRNVDVSTAKVFVSTMHCTDEDLRGRNVYISICFFTAT